MSKEPVISHPKIAEAKALAEKHKKDMVLVFACNEDGSYSWASYGRTKVLCGKAKKLGYAIEEVISDLEAL